MEIVYLLYKYSKDDNSLFFEIFILPIFNELGDTSKKNSLRVMHVGLTNFGSTCYMNSMLQVLNSIDIFRNAVIRANVDIPLIHELKSLFSYLFFSERIDYAPKNLLNAFVPPINPGIQQDTTEFLNFLFDQVEDSLRGTPYRRILP
jgi:ubiquitin carboxyl-terminal hydrolase 34